MNPVSHRLLGAAVITAVLLAGCQPSEPQAPTATETAAAPVTAAPAPKPGELVFELKATDEGMKTQVGTRDAEGLVATGKKGVLAFGPYRTLSPGRYELTLEGTTTTPFALDVVSARAQDTHGKKEVLPTQGATPLASLPFDLAKPVNDLEVRVLVPEGADTRVTSYKIVQR